MANGRCNGSGISFILLCILSLWMLSGLVKSSPSLPSSASSSPSRRHRSGESSPKFWIFNDTFWKDDRPFQIIGGDVHYFRILPQYWEDRLTRAKALGLNTIQTYVPWNLHEPLPRKWSFDGIADILSFLKTSQELGFLVMLRVGPYICAEWDLGGFPAWLLTIEPEIRLRSSDSAFLQLVKRWWDILLPKIVPYLYENGGPIIMVQIENEFGSYGDDQLYLSNLVALARRHLGDDIILYTTDGGYWDNLEKGTIQGQKVLAAVDFSTGEDAWIAFKRQKMFNEPGKSPPLSSEFYTGWLTHWGEQIASTDAEFTAAQLEKILSGNGSAVLYMAHGGSNFGFYSGANIVDNASDYRADLTSYDYDAPIKETGDVDNAKFKALRSVIEKFSTQSLPPIPLNNRKTAFGPIKVNKVASLFEMLIKADTTTVIQSEKPLSMESIGQMFGFLLYVSEYPMKKIKSTIEIEKLHDRGQVFVSCVSSGKQEDPIYVGTLERWSNRRVVIPRPQCTSSNTRIYILVENMGRVNYGKYIYDRKGILSDVLLDGVPIKNWSMFPIPFNNMENFLLSNPIMQVANSKNDILSSYHYRSHPGVPAYYQGSFTINPKDLPTDTFISLRGWSKGIVFVNNFNIGRFWSSVGPQCTLYVPAPILQPGRNKVTIFELQAPNPQFEVNFVKEPDFSCS